MTAAIIVNAPISIRNIFIAWLIWNKFKEILANK